MDEVFKYSLLVLFVALVASQTYFYLSAIEGRVIRVELKIDAWQENIERKSLSDIIGGDSERLDQLESRQSEIWRRLEYLDQSDERYIRGGRIGRP